MDSRDRARGLRLSLAFELQAARLKRHLSQRHVARLTGVSQSYYSRIERGEAPGVTLEQLCLAFEAVGMDLSAQPQAIGGPARDEAKLRLLGDFQAKLPATAVWSTELALRFLDQPTWDAVVRLGAIRIGVEAVIRFRDVQSVIRRVKLKKRDGELPRVVLLVRGTRMNRVIARLCLAELAATFPISPAIAMRELVAGRDPGGDALVFLNPVPSAK